MTDHIRNNEDRRYRSGTRSGQERRENSSDDWKFIEKRHKKDRRIGQRRSLTDRREEGA